MKGQRIVIESEVDRQMDLQDCWEKALKYTEIIRGRIKPLQTFEATPLPYIFLAESKVNIGDTVVRKGEVIVEKPSIIMPNYLPRFEGFEFDQNLPVGENSLITFLLVRGIRFPSFKYNNKTESLDVQEGRIKKVVEQYLHELQNKEDIATGLLTGPEDVWQFSILILICHQILKQTDGDIRRLLDEYRKGES